MNYCIISLCSKNYKDAYAFIEKSWKKSNAEEIIIFTDDESWTANDSRIKIRSVFSQSSDWLVNVGRKVACLEYAINETSHTNIVFLDIDCYLIKDIGHVFSDDFDLGVLRFDKPELSTGVFFVKRSARITQFISDWKKKQEEYKRKKIGVKPRAGSYSQLSYTELVRSYDKNKILKIGKYCFDKYSLKIKDTWKGRESLLKTRGETYIKKLEQSMYEKIREIDIHVLHFYNNSYRNKDLVNSVFLEVSKKQA